MWEAGKWSYIATIELDCTVKDGTDYSTICERIGGEITKNLEPLAVWCPDIPEVKPWVKQGVQTISEGTKFAMFADFLRIMCDLDPITDENQFVIGLK